jgi:hypothetical protein
MSTTPIRSLSLFIFISLFFGKKVAKNDMKMKSEREKHKAYRWTRPPPAPAANPSTSVIVSRA